MSRTRIIAGKAVILIDAKENIDRTLNSIRTKLNKFANTAATIGDNLFRSGFFGSIGSGLIIKQFTKFDDIMKQLQVSLGYVGKMSSDQESKLKSLTVTVRELGKTSSATSVEVANAAVRLAKAGLTPREIEDSLQAILDLGIGTQTAFDTSADMFVRTMKAFNLPASEATKIVSQFVIASNKGVLDLVDLEAALRYSQGTAGNLNQELSDMLAILVELSNKGLVGSIGGTSLNTMMDNLVKKFPDLEKSVKGFNAAIDETGNINIVQTLKRLFAATAKMSPIEQQKLFSNTFNLRGNRAAMGAKDIKRIEALSKEIYAATNQARLGAEVMNSGLGGAFRRTTGAAEDLAIALGKTLDTALQKILNSVTTLLNVLNTVTSQNPTAAGLLIASPAILLASGIGFIALSKGLRLAASAAGLFKSAYQPIANLLTYGTVGQLTKIQSFAKSAPSRFSKARAGAAEIFGGIASGSGQLNQARKNLTIRASYTKRLGQLARLEWTYNKRYERLTETVLFNNPVTNKTYKQALKDRNDTVQLMQKNQRTIARLTPKRNNLVGFGSLFAKGAIKGGQGTLSLLGRLTVGLFRFASGIRRFVFSASGFLTILEFLLIFGNKIPIIAAGFERIGKAIGAIGNQIKLLSQDIASGPWNLIKLAFSALNEGESAIGFQAITAALNGIVDLVGIRLVQAWADVKTALGPIYTFFQNLITTIGATIDHIIIAIGAIISQVSGGVGDLFGGSGSITFGNLGEKIAVAAQYIVDGLGRFIVQLTYLLDRTIQDLAALLGKTNILRDRRSDEYFATLKEEDRKNGRQLNLPRLAALRAEADRMAAEDMNASTPETRRNAALAEMDRSLKEALDKIKASFEATAKEATSGLSKDEWIANWIKTNGTNGKGNYGGKSWNDLTPEEKAHWKKREDAADVSRAEAAYAASVPRDKVAEEAWMKDWIDKNYNPLTSSGTVGGKDNWHHIDYKDLTDEQKASWNSNNSMGAQAEAAKAFAKQFPNGIPLGDGNKAASDLVTALNNLAAQLRKDLEGNINMARIQAEYEELHNGVVGAARKEQQFDRLGVINGRVIAASIVGSIGTVMRNLVAPPVNYEKLQLEEQKKTNEILKGLDVEGGLL